MNRRKYLSITGASVTAVLSGCAERSNSGNGLSSNISEGTQATNQDNRGNNLEDNTSENTQTAQNGINDAEPNGVPEFEIIQLEVPDEITQPETIDVELTVENTGDARGRFRGEVDIDVDGVFLPKSIQYDAEIGAGERTTLTKTLDPTHSGFVTFSLESVEHELMVIPEQTEPQIQGVRLIREWNEYGDVFQNAIDSASVGKLIVIGVRYWYWHGDSGTLDVSVEYETEGKEISHRDVTQDGSKRIVRQRGWEPREDYIKISTFRWDAGEYTTRVQIHDERIEGLSATKEVTYTLK
ncbi:hypothetical protein [Halorubrum yunnanense]|uniref:hypothetical protein n=1 Tax=Halorubrum yunnanense TaxID=1526162 RepID=UPI00226DD6F7|nr:hypothetical protein [Halorubrum yunnanense]